jgi:hypothetical protein
MIHCSCISNVCGRHDRHQFSHVHVIWQRVPNREQKTALVIENVSSVLARDTEQWQPWSEATDSLGNDDVTQSLKQRNHTRWPQDVSRSSCCILHVVMEWLVNIWLERIWKEVNVVRLRCHYGICMHRLRETSDERPQVSQNHSCDPSAFYIQGWSAN